MKKLVYILFISLFVASCGKQPPLPGLKGFSGITDPDKDDDHDDDNIVVTTSSTTKGSDVKINHNPNITDPDKDDDHDDDGITDPDKDDNHDEESSSSRTN